MQSSYQIKRNSHPVKLQFMLVKQTYDCQIVTLNAFVPQLYISSAFVNVCSTWRGLLLLQNIIPICTRTTFPNSDSSTFKFCEVTGNNDWVHKETLSPLEETARGIWQNGYYARHDIVHSQYKNTAFWKVCRCRDKYGERAYCSRFRITLLVHKDDC